MTTRRARQHREYLLAKKRYALENRFEESKPLIKALREALAEAGNAKDLRAFRRLGRELQRVRRAQRRGIARWIKITRRMENLR